MAKLNGTMRALIPMLLGLVGVLVTVFIFTVRNTNTMASNNREDITELRITDERVETNLMIVIKNQEKMSQALDDLLAR